MKPLLNICIVTIGLMVCSVVNGSVFALSPIHDTLVDGVNPDSNFGGAHVLVTVDPYPSDRYTYSYLMFDLSGIPASEAIAGASLRLYQFDGAAYAQNVGTLAFHVSDDTWTESSLTWNTMPETSSRKPLAYNSNGSFYRGWSTWEPFVQDSNWENVPIGGWDWSSDTSDGKLSLRLEQAVGGLGSHGWYSKEFTDSNLRPLLVITTVPLPASFWLMGSVLVAFGMRCQRVRRNP